MNCAAVRSVDSGAGAVQAYIARGSAARTSDAQGSARGAQGSARGAQGSARGAQGSARGARAHFNAKYHEVADVSQIRQQARSSERHVFTRFDDVHGGRCDTGIGRG